MRRQRGARLRKRRVRAKLRKKNRRGLAYQLNSIDTYFHLSRCNAGEYFLP